MIHRLCLVHPEIKKIHLPNSMSNRSVCELESQSFEPANGYRVPGVHQILEPREKSEHLWDVLPIEFEKSFCMPADSGVPSNQGQPIPPRISMAETPNMQTGRCPPSRSRPKPKIQRESSECAKRPKAHRGFCFCHICRAHVLGDWVDMLGRARDDVFFHLISKYRCLG